jgi:hypothetical protein
MQRDQEIAEKRKKLVQLEQMANRINAKKQAIEKYQ